MADTIPDWAAAPAAVKPTAPDWAQDQAPEPVPDWAKPADISQVKASPYEEIYLRTGQKDPGMQPGNEFLTAVAQDPKGFLKSIPGSTGEVIGRVSGVPYQAWKLAVYSALGQADVGVGGDADITDKYLADLSKTNPALATAGKITQGVAQMAPMLGVGALPEAAQSLLARGFTADMLYHAPQTAKALYDELQKPVDERDPDKITGLISDGAQQVLFGTLGGVHEAAALRDGLVNKYVPRGQAMPASTAPGGAATIPDWAQGAPAAESETGNPGTPRPADDWLPAEVPADGHQGEAATAAPVEEAAPDWAGEPVQTSVPTSVGATMGETGGDAEVPGRPSPMVTQALSEALSDRGQVPVSLLKQAGVGAETLPAGYGLNDDGTAYEFTAPAPTVTPEQMQAREAVQAMAELRAAKASKGEEDQQPTVLADGHQGEARADKLVPVDVSPAEVKAAMDRGERAPDILDSVADHFPNGVKFSREDTVADLVKNARGAATDLMSHTAGEDSDKVLDGLHREGLFRQVQSEDELALAMKNAADVRMNERAAANPQARALAEEAKRTQLWDEVSRNTRDNSQRLTAGQLFAGDEFMVNGQRMRVVEPVMDAETQTPAGWQLAGAYGRQFLPADAEVHLDAGSLKSPALGDKLLSGLDKLKIDLNSGQLHAFGLVPAAWNALVDGIKLAVRGGMALKEAIDAGIARLKASGQAGAAFDEDRARAHLEKTLGVRQFGQQVQAAGDVSDATKGTVTNTVYTRRPQEDDAAFAQRIMQAVGDPDRARDVFNDPANGLPQPVRMALGMQILKTYDAAGRHTDAASFFDRDLAPHTTEVAQGLAMLNAWHALSKEGKLVWAQKKIADARRDATAPVKPDGDAAHEELTRQNAKGIEDATKDPAVQAAAKAAVTDAVANSDETHKGVVMELTQPWASAQVILDMARAQVHAKANELLNSGARPPGFTVAQHLRAIMDDLAKRAASIAAGHYQGAEPGVILRDKLMQRLGLAKEQAQRLANQLDREFERQVKAAQDALPKRLARQVAKIQKGLPADATETAVDRSIRRQLGETKQTLGTVVRQHWTKVDATKATLADKLVKQAGLTGDAAAKLAATIQKRFEALTAQAKARALDKILKPIKRLGLAKPQMVDKLVQLSHLGALDQKAFWDALQERMNLPEWTAGLRDALKGLADRIGKIPEDRIEEVQRAQTDFLNTLERAKGISNLELGMAFYMQNILSGLTTHVRVAIHTSTQMMAATAAEMGQALVDGRLGDVPLIFEALGRGFGKALTQQKDIFKSGVVVGSKLKQAVPLSVLEQIKFGQKGGTTVKQGPMAKAILENKLASILNLWKYNGRLITAQHMLYFKPAEEMKVALLAARQARTEGLQGRAAVDRARQILGYGAAQVRAAEAQAIREGLEGTKQKMRVAEILQQGIDPKLRETARDYALRQTFLNDPYGFAGSLANVIGSLKQSENAKLAMAARVIVPFTRIAANLFNEGLNYTPVGAARAYFAKTELGGQKFADITPEVRSDMQRELYAKAALGSMLLTGIAYKAAQGLNQPNPGFTVYGAGPSNPQDKEAWRATGAIPYSIKIGGRYVSYANTPGNVMMATLGNYLDGMRDAALYQRPGAKRLSEDLPMRAAAAAIGASKVIMEQPFLASMLEISKMTGENNAEVAGRSGLKTAARMASSFVVPNLVRQADRFFDPTAYEQRTVDGIVTSQVPFVRQQGRPVLNALGQPIQSPVFGMFTSKQTEDPLVETLADHNAWPALPDRNRTAVNGVPLTDDEFYTYTKTRGQALTQMLSDPSVQPLLDQLASQTDQLKAQADAAANPVVKARLTAVAAKLQSEVMAKYESAADKQAAAAVIRVRGY